MLLSKIATCMISSVCGARGKESAYQCRKHKRCEFDPCIRKITWRRDWQPTAKFLPGESHGQWSLVVYSSCCHKESDMGSHSLLQGIFHPLIELRYSALQADSLLSEPQGKSTHSYAFIYSKTIIEYFVWIQFSHSVVFDSVTPWTTGSQASL